MKALCYSGAQAHHSLGLGVEKVKQIKAPTLQKTLHGPKGVCRMA